MDSNGNLSIPERRAIKRGDMVIYQTEGTAHRGEQRGRVNYVGASGIVWIGTTGSRYVLACDYVRRADWTPEAAPEAAKRVDGGKAGKGTPAAPDAPAGQETRSSGVCGPTLVQDKETGLTMAPAVALEALRARVEALTVERDRARQKLKTMMMAAVALIETAKEVCGE